MSNVIYEICANEIRHRINFDGEIELALILGSGLNHLADELTEKDILPYGQLPGFIPARVPGHFGNLIFGKLNGIPLICLQGRAHIYEGHDPTELCNPIRALKTLGLKVLIQTNAAGSLNPDVPPGSLAAVTDHINFFGYNPLVGSNDENIGGRFFDVSNAYDPEIIKIMEQASTKVGIDLKKGVYGYFPGPNFETPAEIRAMKILGADLVGMSTVQETLIARHANIKNVAVSCVTNLAAGYSNKPVSHEETISETKKAGSKMSSLIKQLVEDLVSNKIVYE